MYSGGLDSILAAKVIAEEGIEVIALHLYNGFNGSLRRDIERGPTRSWTPEPSIVAGTERLGIKLIALDVADEFIDVLHEPRYGYGSAVNPCIDCRIFALRKAREIMESEQAAFVFTGEVLGQRPMSQYRNALELVARKSGFEGRLLRPLSALLLEPTIPERDGTIDRSRLHGFSGRSRKPQKELAERYGIDWYPNSGGGCLLTDTNYAAKYKDIVEHSDGRKPDKQSLMSLKTGRHLRLAGGVKVIIGRIEAENDYLRQLLGDRCWMFEARDFAGASVFAFDEPREEDFPGIASICARYGKGSAEDTVTVIASKGSLSRELEVKPAVHKDIEPFFIDKKKKRFW